MRAIDVEGLVVRYGPTTAVRGVSLAVDRGEVLALLGPNGAGKTTAVETIEGYRRPSAGTVRVLGLDPVAQRTELAPQIGVMLQSGGVHPGIRPLEALRLFASYYRDPEDPVALLERVGLGHVRDSGWRRLSGGEQQRLSLALALVGRPTVAFLDEPTAGIDVTGRQLVRDIITGLRKAGVAVLLTTHDLEEAERTADCIAIIDRGHVLASGTPADLLTRGAPEEIRFGAPPDLDTAALGRALNAFVDETSPGQYKVDITPSPAHVAALTAWLADYDLPLWDLRAGRQRLEDVFKRLTHITGEIPTVADDGSPLAELAPDGANTNGNGAGHRGWRRPAGRRRGRR
jgi:ABC-2 type transport system ATP-binding protein